ncbi:MAG: hypothetical protein ISS35_02175 [Kiritimatiellae bacterium]|nr:hypothetical protein [Kiritimatiellia bacterium]
MIKASLFSFLAITILWTAPCAHGFGNMHVVVKRQDRLGNESYKVMSRTEFRELEKKCRKEASYATKALSLAQRAWKEDSNNTSPFPRSVAKPIKVRAMREFKEKEDAREMASKYTERENEQAKKREADLKRKHSKQSWTRGRGRGNNRRTSKVDTKSLKKATDKLEERKATLERACTLYESMLVKCREEAEERRKKSAF